MCARPQRAQQRDVPAEVDLGLAVVDLVGSIELDALELGHDVRPEDALEHLDVAGALAPQLVALRRGCRRSSPRRAKTWAPNPCSGWKCVTVRKSGLPSARRFACASTYSALSQAHARVDDEHGACADDEADVRHERHAAVGDDEDAVGDLDGISADDRRRGHVLLHLGHGSLSSDGRVRRGVSHSSPDCPITSPMPDRDPPDPASRQGRPRDRRRARHRRRHGGAPRGPGARVAVADIDVAGRRVRSPPRSATRRSPSSSTCATAPPSRRRCARRSRSSARSTCSSTTPRSRCGGRSSRSRTPSGTTCSRSTCAASSSAASSPARTCASSGAAASSTSARWPASRAASSTAPTTPRRRRASSRSRRRSPASSRRSA